VGLARWQPPLAVALLASALVTATAGNSANARALAPRPIEVQRVNRAGASRSGSGPAGYSFSVCGPAVLEVLRPENKGQIQPVLHLFSTGHQG